MNIFRHEDLATILPKLRSREIKLFLPKWKFECSYSLVESLKKLGMTDACGEAKADFSKMTSEVRIRQLQVSELIVFFIVFV